MAAIKHLIQVWDECVCIGGGGCVPVFPTFSAPAFVPRGSEGSVLLLQNIVLLQAGLLLYRCSACSVMLCRLLNPDRLVFVLRFSWGKGYLADLWVVEQSRRAIAVARLL